MFIENLLGSKAKVKILRVLSELRTAYALKDLSLETGLSSSITHKAAEELVGEGIMVKIKGTRKERLYKFNNDSSFAQQIFDIFRTEKSRQRKEIIFLKIWSLLEQVLAKVKDKISIMVLFGSHARGNATLNSDVDVLIIPQKENLKGEILDDIKTISNKVNPMFLTLETFKRDMKNNTPFYKNLKCDGIVLHLDGGIKEDLTEFLSEVEHGNR